MYLNKALCCIPLLRKSWWGLRNEALKHGASFAGEPCFPHNIMGIFISGESIIGKNCVIFQQVTIGSNRIADSVWGNVEIDRFSYLNMNICRRFRSGVCGMLERRIWKKIIKFNEKTNMKREKHNETNQR